MNLEPPRCRVHQVEMVVSDKAFRCPAQGCVNQIDIPQQPLDHAADPEPEQEEKVRPKPKPAQHKPAPKKETKRKKR